MSFARAADLLRLAGMARGRHPGVSLDDIRAGFGRTHAPEVRPGELSREGPLARFRRRRLV